MFRPGRFRGYSTRAILEGAATRHRSVASDCHRPRRWGEGVRASAGSLAVRGFGPDIGGRVGYSVFEDSLTEDLKRKLADLPHTFL